MGGDTGGTADPTCPKGYSIPCDIVLSNKTGGVRAGGELPILGNWLGISLLVVSNCFPRVLFSSLRFFFLF